MKRWLREHLWRKGYALDRVVDPGILTDWLSQIRPLASARPLIRIGSDHDGGYLVPDDLEGIDGCFSPGVDKSSDFEWYFAERGVPCYLADYSVDAPPLNHRLFSFEKFFVGPRSGGIYRSLEDWVGFNAPNAKNLILQMDIEGAEYGVLLSSPLELLARFRIVVVEFHRLDAMFSRNGFELISGAIDKLLKMFEIVHIHPNNVSGPFRNGGLIIPPVMEFTLLRRDRDFNRNIRPSFPHPLDRKNLPHLQDVPVPACWSNNVV